MIWTLVLVPYSIVAVWLAARHWYGWLMSATSEVLWAAYALSLHSQSLLVMSGVWAVIHARNTVRTYRDQDNRHGIAQGVTLTGRYDTMTDTATPDPAHLAIEGYDPDQPVFEVWVNGRRFACTQTPTAAYRYLTAIRLGRPAHTPPELRVVNDRRSTSR